MSIFSFCKSIDFRRRLADLRARSERGVAAVEFALMLPVLLLLLGGIMEFGSIYYVKNNMATVARDVARRLALGELTQVQAEQEVEDQLVAWDLTLTITVTMPTAVTTDYIVLIETPLASAGVIDLASLGVSGTLAAHAITRQEG